MALRIRMQRHGAAHAPVYRMVVTESTHRRDGRNNEVLGINNPKARGQDLEINLKLDRIDYWISVGAKPTDTARTLINRARREAGLVASVPSPQPAKKVEAKAEEPKAEETAPAPAAEAPVEAEAAPAEEAPAKEEPKAEAAPEAVAEAPKAEEAPAAEEPKTEAAAPAEEEKKD